LTSSAINLIYLPEGIQMSALEAGQRTGMRTWLKMVEALRQGPGWAADDLPVDIIQTHISVVLLSKHHALKLKKPVNFGFLDYTTLENRRNACEAEVSLNRRLFTSTCSPLQLSKASAVSKGDTALNGYTDY
jgi:hypothetical protein